mmetsp:Transcript_83857/g.256219  ORF Transcript_83857/g.256219 Transcript_83857/m.256219 type:complete len:230 (-) Transcript_83857:280-969(-)
MPTSCSESSSSNWNSRCLQSSIACSIMRAISSNLPHCSSGLLMSLISISGRREKVSLTLTMEATTPSRRRLSWYSFNASCRRYCSTSTHSCPPSGNRASSLTSTGNVQVWYSNDWSMSSGNCLHRFKIRSTTSRILSTSSLASCIFRTMRCKVPTSHLHRPSSSEKADTSPVLEMRAPRSLEESGRLCCASSPMLRISSSTRSALSSRSRVGTLSSSLFTLSRAWWGTW